MNFNEEFDFGFLAMTFGVDLIKTFTRAKFDTAKKLEIEERT